MIGLVFAQVTWMLLVAWTGSQTRRWFSAGLRMCASSRQRWWRSGSGPGPGPEPDRGTSWSSRVHHGGRRGLVMLTHSAIAGKGVLE
jgi:hypothetical protein